MPKNHPKIYTKPPNSGWWNKQRDLKCRLKCDRDIGRKAVLSDVKEAFTFTLSLSLFMNNNACLRWFLNWAKDSELSRKTKHKKFLTTF